MDLPAFDSRDPASYAARFDALWPICRSITGEGLRRSLDMLGDEMGMTREGVASGTRVFDWTVPPEWTIRGARLTGPDGRVVADMAETNLRVVNYAAPVDRELDLAELQAHLHSIPGQPDLIPYVTSYYRRDWGFCLRQTERDTLVPGRYRATIDADLSPGEVSYSTGLLPANEGDNGGEVLLTSYLCHPSMANNELSGPLVLRGLHDRIAAWPRRRYGYRFLLNPETIGSLCYLHDHGAATMADTRAGLVLTCLGGPAPRLSFKASRRGDAPLDRLAAHLAATDGDMGPELRPFDPTGGSDERQFCAPGFDLPMGQMARTIYGRYPEYHTSGDDRALMGFAPLVDAVDRIEEMLMLHETMGPWRSTAPMGEPQLGRRGLYPSVNSPTNWHLSNDETMDARAMLDTLLWVLSDADGMRDLLGTSARSGIALRDMVPVVRTLEAQGLIVHAGVGAGGAP